MADIERLAEELQGQSRRARQNAAEAIASLAAEDPAGIISIGDALVEAMNVPEAHTRWELLNAFSCLIGLDVNLALRAFDDAETALFDEESGPLRLAAMRYLCKLGAVSEELSKKAWPFIDEAIQCYHGDFEYKDMLLAVADFAQGALDEDVKAQLIARLEFDAENDRSALGRRTKKIIDTLA